MGKFVPRAMLGVEVANEITGSTQAGSPDVITVVMFQDIGDSRICNLGSAAVIYGWLLWVPPVGWWSMCRWPMLLWTRQTESTEAISR